MPSTTYPEFNDSTEAIEVAKVFADGLRGKTALVTGVNRNGIGFSAAEAIASQSPAHLIIAGRSLEKIQESVDAIKTQYPNVDYRPLQVNLSSQASVRSAATELMGWSDVPTVDIVINSAGIMLIPERTITEDGIEITFATNHIGHYLLTCLIMPKLIKAAENNPKGATRIVNVSSASPMFASMRWSDTNFDKKTTDLPETERPNPIMHKQWGVDDVSDWSYIPLEAYNQSKVANVLFSIGITQRLYEKHGILGLAVHPGIIVTELGRSMKPELVTQIRQWEEKGAIKYKTLGAGASTGLVAALDPKLGPGVPKDDRENWGVYLEDCQITNKANPLAVATAEAEKLWKRSEELVKEEFAW